MTFPIVNNLAVLVSAVTVTFTPGNRRASGGLNLNFPDQVPQRRLDGILWRFRHGPHSVPPPPGPNASLEPGERER